MSSIQSKPSKFYIESGEFNMVGLAVSMFLLFIGASLIGFLYALLVNFLPIIYINILICIGVGIIIGYLVRFLGRVTHNRSKKSLYGLALFAGLVANLFQWTFFMIYAFDGVFPSFPETFTAIDWLLQPSDFIGNIIEINRIGLWEVFGIPFNLDYVIEIVMRA